MAEILVAGISTRALAASAGRAGYAPLAADLFMDLDLEDQAEECVRIDGDLVRGVEWEPLERALDALASGRAPIGIACSAGFEDRPDLLDRIARRWPLLGNSGEAVQRAKDPEHLAALCARLGIPHPELRFEGGCGSGWLRKERGGAGGGHVAAGADRRSDSYWQRRVEGDPVSALALGNGTEAITIGLSAQWADPAPGAPFRYGGAAQPTALSRDIEASLRDAATRTVSALGLVGLNSVDFLVASEGWNLIEVNPRPGATLDIFESNDAPLFALHMAACRGELPAEPPVYVGAAASRIVYARGPVHCVRHIDWPDWTADRQRPGTSLAVGAPVCTVLARADTAEAARALVMERGDLILTAVGAV